MIGGIPQLQEMLTQCLDDRGASIPDQVAQSSCQVHRVVSLGEAVGAGIQLSTAHLATSQGPSLPQAAFVGEGLSPSETKSRERHALSETDPQAGVLQLRYHNYMDIACLCPSALPGWDPGDLGNQHKHGVLLPAVTWE